MADNRPRRARAGATRKRAAPSRLRPDRARGAIQHKSAHAVDRRASGRVSLKRAPLSLAITTPRASRELPCLPASGLASGAHRSSSRSYSRRNRVHSRIIQLARRKPVPRPRGGQAAGGDATYDRSSRRATIGATAAPPSRTVARHRRARVRARARVEAADHRGAGRAVRVRGRDRLHDRGRAERTEPPQHRGDDVGPLS